MQTMRIRANAIFEEISYMPIMSLSGRVAIKNLIEKELIAVFNEATNSPNNQSKWGTLNDISPIHTQARVDGKDSRLANLDIEDFVGKIDVTYY